LNNTINDIISQLNSSFTNILKFTYEEKLSNEFDFLINETRVERKYYLKIENITNRYINILGVDTRKLPQVIFEKDTYQDLHLKTS
jgi:hypothetical protein